ncbi:golgi apparatus membrane protein-like protein tvp38 [Bimuria novae-zelandiae CBS 107.79]|uniref:Golgi apparatus membrane protein TVP38 n=1 Tax=Bimuria novae-zelandiae CBS 107.79 TaxID=1447943 RepID=A0A6A5VEG4_9PLEO|nr:golgi apparatus membrane protein-like protein tvp38 [Bimuria novae-zelandiae CBS 107.79]
MPVEEDYNAQALALALDDDEPPERGPSPIWTRRSHSNSFRQNRPHSSSSARPQTGMRQLVDNYNKLSRKYMTWYDKLSVLKKILFSLAGITIFVLSILFLIYNERIFHALRPAAEKWRNITAGWLILWALIFVVSFPPLIGYSSLMTIAGFVYGFPNGWFIAATATVAGSTASFLASRSLLKSMVHRLVANDKRFAALALTLKYDGLKLLIMIRLCPLPYSLCNGAIATFPTVSALSYALATAIVSPKLMLHIFIGAQLAQIADGDKMDAKSKALSYVSIAIGGIAGAVTGWFMYKKTKERAAQLEAEERAGIRRMSIEDLEREYVDDPAALEAAETLREDDDDISLRSGWGDEYHDDATDAEDDALEISDDPFGAGDADHDSGGTKK